MDLGRRVRLLKGPEAVSDDPSVQSQRVEALARHASDANDASGGGRRPDLEVFADERSEYPSADYNQCGQREEERRGWHTPGTTSPVEPAEPADHASERSLADDDRHAFILPPSTAAPN